MTRTRSTPLKKNADEVVYDSGHSAIRNENEPLSDTKSSGTGANVLEDGSDYDNIDDLDSDYDYDAEELEALEEAAGISRQSVALLDVETRIHLLKKRGSAKLLTKPLAQRRASVGGKWNESEDANLREIVQKHGPKNWKKIASLLGDTRTDVQCLHRWNKVLKPGLHKGSWLVEEDQIVREMVNLHGVGNVKWSLIAARLPGRIGKQCRERWFNHLDPAIVRVDWAQDEDVTLFEAQRHFGNRWCEISKILPGRTENAVKNRWNSSTMKKWLKDNDLVPGPGTPLQDLSLEGMHHVLVSFCGTLAKKSVHIEYDTVAEMLGLGDLLLPGGGQLENSVGSDGKSVSGLLRKDSSDKKGDKGKSKKNQSGPSPSSTTSISNGLPAHLRPSLINTDFDTTKSDDTTKQLIEMLHQLKSTPSPQNADANTDRKRKRRLKIEDTNFDEDAPAVSHKKRARKEKASGHTEFEEFPDLLDDWSLKNAISAKEKGAKRGGRGGRTGRGGRAAGRNGHFFQTETLMHPTSPTIRAWDKIMTSLQGSSSRDTVNQIDMLTEEFDEMAPLQLLQYFKFLRESAQKSIVKQLIERFQRTSCTPRNAVLPTPRYESGSVDGMSDFLSLDYLGALGTPRFGVGAVDPNCFELEYGDILQTGAQWSGSSDHMPPPSPMGMQSNNPLNSSSNVTSDETAVEATVMIVLQIVNKSPSSDQLLKAIIQGPSVVHEGVPGLTPHNGAVFSPLKSHF